MTDVTDSFTGTNGTQLTAYSSNWTLAAGSSDPDIQSNHASPDAAADDSFVYWNANSFEDDQYCQLLRSGVQNQDISIGPAVRMNASGHCYFMYLRGGAAIYLYLYDGSFNQLDFSDGTTTGHTYKIDATGTAITTYDDGDPDSMPNAINGVLGSGAAGMYAYDDDATEFADDWLAGPIVAAGAPAPNITDNATLTDSRTVTVSAPQISRQDNATLTDSVTVSVQAVTPASINNQDNATLTDSIILTVSAPQVISQDDATLTDSTTITVSDPEILFQDDTTITDSATVSIEAAGQIDVNNQDDATLTDSITLTVSDPEMMIADNNTLTDLVTVQVEDLGEYLELFISPLANYIQVVTP